MVFPCELSGAEERSSLKVDKGLADQVDGAQVMKPMPELDALLERAVSANIFGTKMRSVISSANLAGVSAVVSQQFEVGHQILSPALSQSVSQRLTFMLPIRLRPKRCFEMPS